MTEELPSNVSRSLFFFVCVFILFRSWGPFLGLLARLFSELVLG